MSQKPKTDVHSVATMLLHSTPMAASLWMAYHTRRGTKFMFTEAQLARLFESLEKGHWMSPYMVALQLMMELILGFPGVQVSELCVLRTQMLEFAKMDLLPENGREATYLGGWIYRLTKLIGKPAAPGHAAYRVWMDTMLSEADLSEVRNIMGEVSHLITENDAISEQHPHQKASSGSAPKKG